MRIKEPLQKVVLGGNLVTEVRNAYSKKREILEMSLELQNGSKVKREW